MIYYAQFNASTLLQGRQGVITLPVAVVVIALCAVVLYYLEMKYQRDINVGAHRRQSDPDDNSDDTAAILRIRAARCQQRDYLLDEGARLLDDPESRDRRYEWGFQA